MDKLGKELARLYPPSSAGRVRTLVIDFLQAGDWPALAGLYQAVQEELDLPAPAISVSGTTGFGLWFSLAEALPEAKAKEFLNALHNRYLAEIPLTRLAFQPPAVVSPVPALREENDKWSAYIDPTLGGMFAEEPWLEMAPNPDKQADILAGLASIKLEDFQRALIQLQAPAPVEPAPAAARQLGAHFNDPHSFLLAVMNDETASLDQRIQAAAALLPYFTKP